MSEVCTRTLVLVAVALVVLSPLTVLTPGWLSSSVQQHTTVNDIRDIVPFPWMRQSIEAGLEQNMCQGKVFPSWLQRMQRLRRSSNASLVTELTHGIGGLGDQSRGVSAMTMMSVLTDRAYFLHWTQPVSVSPFLEPNLYNWTLPADINATCHDETSSALRSVIHKDHYWLANITDETLPCVRTISRDTYNDDPGDASVLRNDVYMKGCVWNVLFRPTARFRHTVTRTRQELGITNDTTLLAIHARFGGNFGINDRHYRDNVDKRLGSASIEDLLTCAHKMEQHFHLDPNRTKWYLAADSMDSHRTATRLYPDKVVAPNKTRIIHTGHPQTTRHLSHAEKEEAFEQTLLDLYMLASADYTVRVKSGFNQLAQGVGLVNGATVTQLRGKPEGGPAEWSHIC